MIYIKVVSVWICDRTSASGSETDAIFEDRKNFLPGQSSRTFPIMGGRHRAATVICNDVAASL
jgi:hypothetical protein